MASRTQNLGPLLTTFEAPPSCSVYIVNNINTAAQWRLAQTCSSNTIIDDTNCWPTPTVLPNKNQLNGFGFYSPGLICPIGYSTACSTTASVTQTNNDSLPTGFQPRFPLMVGETAIGCCPIGLSYINTQGSQMCVATITTGTSVNIGQCTASSQYTIYSASLGQILTVVTDAPPSTSTTMTSHPDTATPSTSLPLTITTTTSVSPAGLASSSTIPTSQTITTVALSPQLTQVTLLGPMIQLVHQNSDLANAMSALPSTNGNMSNPNHLALPPAENSTNLDGTTKILIGVGILLGVMMITGLIIHFFLYKRRQKQYRDLAERLEKQEILHNQQGREVAALMLQNQQVELSGERSALEADNPRRSLGWDTVGRI